MKIRATSIAAGIVLLIALEAAVSGISELATGRTGWLAVAKIGVAVAGIAAVVAHFRGKRKLSDVLYYLWFLPQFVVVATLYFSPDRSRYLEVVSYSVSDLNFGFHLDWKLKSGGMLAVHFNLLFIFGAYFLQKVNRKEANQSSQTTPVSAPR